MKPQSHLLASIRSRESSMIETLKSWVSINSGSDNGDGLDQMREALESGIEEIPTVDKETIPFSKGKAIRLRCRPGCSRRVFLSGHMDTVYPKDHAFQEWSMIEPNRLVGPGAADMKGGLLVMIEALRAFETSPVASDIGWEVLISTDEEIGSPDSAKLLEEAARRCQIGLVFEPALQGSGNLSRQRLGSASFEVTATGKSAHAGRDFAAGRNAIAGLSAAIASLHKLNKLKDNICNVGSIGGGGPVNVVPETATATFNFRSTDPLKVDSAIKTATSLARDQYGVELDWKGGFTRKPKLLTPEIESLFATYQACAKELGFNLSWRDTGGCCDGNNLAAAGLPNLDNLGVRGGNIHSSEEFVELDSLVERAQLTALFLTKYAESSAPDQDQPQSS
ncbi:MAG: hydrolase [Verrucomicrobiota bacterium]